MTAPRKNTAAQRRAAGAWRRQQATRHHPGDMDVQEGKRGWRVRPAARREHRAQAARDRVLAAAGGVVAGLVALVVFR